MFNLNLLRLRRNFRTAINADPLYGILGDGAGNVYVAGKPGYMWVRQRQAGGYGQAKDMRLDTNANIPPQNNLPVVLGYDYRKELVIKQADGVAMARQGQNPMITNPNDPQNQYVQQQNLLTALCTQDNPLSKYVLVKPWIFSNDEHIYKFNGKRVDLNSYIPSTAGYHCLAGIFILPDLTVEVVASTAKSSLSPIGVEYGDVQEIYNGSSPGATLIWCWRLRNGMTTITDTDSYLDCRQLINVGKGEGDTTTAKLTTTNNTTTTIASVSVAELQAFTIVGEYAANKSDYSAMSTGTFRYGVRRATGGNVTQQAAATISQDGSGVLSLDVDTSTQTARIRATGVTAETWNWKVHYRLVRI